MVPAAGRADAQDEDQDEVPEQDEDQDEDLIGEEEKETDEDDEEEASEEDDADAKDKDQGGQKAKEDKYETATQYYVGFDRDRKEAWLEQAIQGSRSKRNKMYTKDIRGVEGSTDASTTRKPSTPWTRSSASTTASAPEPIFAVPLG